MSERTYREHQEAWLRVRVVQVDDTVAPPIYLVRAASGVDGWTDAGELRPVQPDAPSPASAAAALSEAETAIQDAYGLLPSEAATEDDEWGLAVYDSLRFLSDAVEALTAAPPPASAAPGWVHLPLRNTAINLARVTRVEFFDEEQDCTEIYFDHADGEDADRPGHATTATMTIRDADTTALRRALGLP